MARDKVERISYHVAEIMKVLDLDMGDPNLKDTPERFARMYLEIFQGLDEDAEPEMTMFPSEEAFKDMIAMTDITFYSMCCHHLLPFWGRAHLAYIPSDDRIVGLSKLARMVAYHAQRPQIQERLTTQIAASLEREICPSGTMVVVEARHLCMEMRGVEKPGTWTTTSAVRGVFTSRATRGEFLDLLARKREA